MKPYQGMALAALLSVAATTAAAQTADLSITMSADSATATPGSDVTYTITVQNSGPDAAPGAVISDNLLPGLTFVRLTQPGGWACVTPVAGANGTVTCTNASLASGATAHFSITAQLNPAASLGSTVSNTAAVSSTTIDPSAANNSATAAFTVAAPPAAVPTLTEWAMILFVALLAGSAALHLQRRQRAV